LATGVLPHQQKRRNAFIAPSPSSGAAVSSVFTLGPALARLRAAPSTSTDQVSSEPASHLYNGLNHLQCSDQFIPDSSGMVTIARLARRWRAAADPALGEEDLRRLRSPAAENIAAATAVERRPA
jgi:hypothetical protein